MASLDMHFTLARWLSPGRVVLSLVIAVLCVWVLFFASRGFFSGDSGMKFAQAQSLTAQSLGSRDLVYDYQFDPHGRFFPYGDLVRRVGDHHQGIYSVLFTTVAGLGIALFGVHGLILLPLLGAILVAIGSLLVLRRQEYGLSTIAVALPAAVLFTPILFYASQFSEHTLATGLALMGLAAIAAPPSRQKRWAPMVAGAFAALAAAVRPEGYCVVASLGLVVFFQPHENWRDRLRDSALFLAGAVPLLLIYWGINSLSAATWDPVVTRNSDRSSSTKNALTMMIGEVKRASPRSWMAPFAGAILLSLVPRRRVGKLHLAIEWTMKWRLPVLHAVCGGVLAFVTWRAHSLGSGRTAVGLFAVTPVAAYGLLAGPWNPRSRNLWIFAVTFGLQVLALDKSGTAGGLQFGARLLMPALPVLVLLAATTAENDVRALWASRRAKGAALILSIPVVALFIMSAWTNYDGIGEPLKIADGGWQATVAASTSEPDVIVTRRWWESQVMAPVLLSGKRLYDARGNPRALISRLADRGVKRFVLVGGGPSDIPLSHGKIARLIKKKTGWLQIRIMEIQSQRPPKRL